LEDTSEFDPKDLTFPKISDMFDPNSIDCTDDNDTDSQDLQDYLSNHALSDQEQNMSVTYLASYKNKIFGYCTVAISSLPYKKYPLGKPSSGEEIKSYPVLLIANLATDKKNRNIKGIGSEMLRHCVGMGVLLSEIVGCRYVMLYATTAEKFYSEKNKTEYKFFVARVEPDGRKLMLYKLASKIERHVTFEGGGISDKVTATVTKPDDKYT
jgi:hypothetical protein